MRFLNFAECSSRCDVHILMENLRGNPIYIMVTCTISTAAKRHLFPLTFSQALVFACLQYKSFENTVGKEEIARNEQFLLFPQYFLSVGRTFFRFCQISNFCRLQTLSVWKSLKFVVWERVKMFSFEHFIKGSHSSYGFQVAFFFDVYLTS